MIGVNDYQVGGSLPIDTPSYVVRSADCQLYDALQKGEFCYVLDARQMGKSSLMVRTIHQLRQDGYYCTAIDMTRIGGERITPEQWYKGLIVELMQGFNLFSKINFKQWWSERQYLSPVQILSLFIEEILLTELECQNTNSRPPISIFIDEIDSVLALDFAVDDFFSLIRFCYNQRSLNSNYQRLTFVLLGVTTPSAIIGDYRRTPFNIGRAIKLEGFKFQEAKPLFQGLKNTVARPEKILKEILYWTNGQPFLTQKLCQLVSNFAPTISSDNESKWVQGLIQAHVIDNWQAQDEPEHLKTIRDRLLNNKENISSLLTTYQQILKQKFILANNSVEQQELLLSGLIIKEQDKLKVRNLIYRQIFDWHWVEAQLSQLRPYTSSLVAWLKSDCTDTSRLLRGKALEDAQAWSRHKNLSNVDYHFLANSEQLHRQEIQQALEAERTKEIEVRLREKQRTARLQRYLLYTCGLALCSILGFSVFAYEQYHQAKINELEALTNYSEALFASNKKLEALKSSIEIEQKRRNNKKTWFPTFNRRRQQENILSRQIESVLRRSVYGIDEYNRLSGHTRTVFAVDISSNGKNIVTGSEDQTLKLWGMDGTLVKTFKGHQAAIWDVAFSPDAQMIASTSRDRTVKLWHRHNGLQITLKGHRDEVLGVAFSPNGQIIASASRDRTVKLWQPNGKLIDTLEGHDNGVWKAIFSPDGRTLATAGEDKTIKLWQVNSQGRFEVVKNLKGHQGEIRTIAFSPDGKTIASASHDRTAKLWQTDTGKLLHTLTAHTSSIDGVAFSPNGKLIATGSWDNTIKVWNLQGNLLKTIKVGQKRIWDIAFNPQENTIVVASEKIANLVRIDNPLLTVLRGHSEPVIDVAFSPDGKTIASVSDDRTVRLWSDRGSLLSTFTSQQDSVLGIAFSPNGKNLVAGHWNGSLSFLNQSDADESQIQLRKTLRGHKVGTWRVVFSDNGNLIATASEDLSAKLWDLQGNEVATLRGHQDVVRGIAISSQKREIVTASYDGTIKFWNDQGQLLLSLKHSEHGKSAVALSSDGAMMVTGNTYGTLKLWSIERSSGKIVARYLKSLTEHSDEIRKVVFSPNNQLIASASGDGTIKVWNRHGELLNTLYGHNEQVWSVAFSPDSRKIVSSSEDKTVIIWDLNQMFNLDLLAAGCSQIQDYLRTNPQVQPSNRHLCQN